MVSIVNSDFSQSRITTQYFFIPFVYELSHGTLYFCAARSINVSLDRLHLRIHIFYPGLTQKIAVSLANFI